MDWPQLVIALVVITAYVIKHIVSAQQERKAAALRAQPNNAIRVETKSDEEGTPELTELDRRIAGAPQRLRERALLPMPVVVAPVPRYEPPAPQRDRTAQAEVRRIPRSELPRGVPVKVPGPRKRDAPAVAAIRQIVFTTDAATVSNVSPAVRKALDLLKDPQALAAAFVLREILDRPMALRRRRL